VCSNQGKWENSKERHFSYYLGVGDGIMLKWIFQEAGLEHVNWIYLVQERDQWQAVMNAIMNGWAS
jgi:hypothetical protein